MAPVVCASCGLANIPERSSCKQCGESLRAPAPVPTEENSVQLTLDERRDILDAEIVRQVTAGWRVVSRTDTTAQLLTDRGPNGCIGLLLLIFFVVPGILYMLLYKGSSSMYIDVDPFGQVRRTTHG
ncbi:MAG: hypothetical protein RLZZ387_1619 [Chloroflexota bacterium]|jgi:hypothetical protein